MKEQKSQFDDDVENDKNPIEIQLSSVSTDGKMELKFSEELQIPENLGLMIKSRKCEDDSILEIAMIDPYSQVNNNLQYWTIESVSGTGLFIKLHFERPLQVSQDDKPDQLFFHIRMSMWKTLDNRSLPELVVETKDIVRQVHSITEVAIISDVGITTQASAATTVALHAWAMYAAKASLKQVWDALSS